MQNAGPLCGSEQALANIWHFIEMNAQVQSLYGSEQALTSIWHFIDAPGVRVGLVELNINKIKSSKSACCYTPLCQKSSVRVVPVVLELRMPLWVAVRSVMRARRLSKVRDESETFVSGG
jgi:chorismate-pyruvate lyase